MEKLLVNDRDAAQMLGIGHSKILELVFEGELPSVRIGRARRFPVDALREWVRARALKPEVRS